MKLKKLIPLAIAVWPLPVLNGLVIGIASATDGGSIKGSVRTALVSSVAAFSFYFALSQLVKGLPVISDLLLLAVVSALGIAIAVYLSIYVRLRSTYTVMTWDGLTVEYYVKDFAEVEKGLQQLGLKCSQPSYHIEDENHVTMTYQCGEGVVTVDVKKDWKYLRVRAELRHLQP